MLNEQTFEKLNAMKLSGRRRPEEQMETAGVDDLPSRSASHAR